MSKQDGGPATAVSMRDYFAASALQGLLHGVKDPNEANCAAMAYRCADAMLAARERE